MGNKMTNRGHRTAISNYFNTGRKIARQGHKIAISIDINMGRTIAIQGHRIAVSISIYSGHKVASKGHKIANTINFARNCGGATTPVRPGAGPSDRPSSSESERLCWMGRLRC